MLEEDFLTIKVGEKLDQLVVGQLVDSDCLVDQKGNTKCTSIQILVHDFLENDFQALGELRVILKVIGKELLVFFIKLDNLVNHLFCGFPYH